MANTWESLDRSQQMELCRQLGAKTPEDHNRIAQHLSQNPTAVDKALKESGMVDAEDDVTLQEGPTAEDSVDDALAEESSADVQETGSVTSDIPPAEPGEGVEEYIMRLAQGLEGLSGRGVAGPSGMGSDIVPADPSDVTGDLAQDMQAIQRMRRPMRGPVVR